MGNLTAEFHKIAGEWVEVVINCSSFYDIMLETVLLHLDGTDVLPPYSRRGETNGGKSNFTPSPYGALSRAHGLCPMRNVKDAWATTSCYRRDEHIAHYWQMLCDEWYDHCSNDEGRLDVIEERMQLNALNASLDYLDDPRPCTTTLFKSENDMSQQFSIPRTNTVIVKRFLFGMELEDVSDDAIINEVKDLKNTVSDLLKLALGSKNVDAKIKLLQTTIQGLLEELDMPRRIRDSAE